jgi:hypothetical protein
VCEFTGAASKHTSHFVHGWCARVRACARQRMKMMAGAGAPLHVCGHATTRDASERSNNVLRDPLTIARVRFCALHPARHLGAEQRRVGPCCNLREILARKHNLVHAFESEFATRSACHINVKCLCASAL